MMADRTICPSCGGGRYWVYKTKGAVQYRKCRDCNHGGKNGATGRRAVVDDPSEVAIRLTNLVEFMHDCSQHDYNVATTVKHVEYAVAEFQQLNQDYHRLAGGGRATCRACGLVLRIRADLPDGESPFFNTPGPKWGASERERDSQSQ